MDLDFSPEDNAFREEVRAFIADNYPPALRAKQANEEALTKEDYLSWHRILARQGWAAPSWPVEYGGTGWTPTQKYIFSEEQAEADALPVLPFGVNMVAPVIYTFGTRGAEGAASCRASATAIVWWCQGYCEPGAGSDLASLKTKAERITADDGRTTTSSTARRPGRRSPSTPTGSSSSCAPIRRPSRRTASASC